MTMDDARLAELDLLVLDPDTDGARIYDLMAAIGEDLGGLSLLVARHGSSDSPIVRTYVAMALSRAAWESEQTEPALCDLVYSFIEMAGHRDDAGMLSTICNALKGLHAHDQPTVTATHRRQELGEFLLHCLGQGDFMVISACVDLVGDFWCNGELDQLLTPSAIVAIQDRLARLAAEDRDELRNELAELREFWAERA
jgi:hypothetical protein